jgi:hypothetical protein
MLTINWPLIFTKFEIWRCLEKGSVTVASRRKRKGSTRVSVRDQEYKVVLTGEEENEGTHYG